MIRLWMRRVLLGAAGVLVLLAASVGWLVASFDGEHYKTLAVDWMRDERQRSLTLAGPARLSIFPRLRVEFGELRLSERFDPNAEFLLIDEASLAVDPVPLLARQLVVKGIEARGVRLRLARRADDTRNLDDLLGVRGELGAMKLDLRHLAVEDLRASVSDERLPMHGEYRVERLDAHFDATGSAAEVQLRSRVALQRPRLEGELEGSFALQLPGGEGQARLPALQLRFAGSAAGLRELRAELRGEARVDLGQHDVEADNLTLELRADNDDWRLGASTVRAQRLGWNPGTGALAWTGLQANLKGQWGAGRPFSATLQAPRFAAGPNGAEGQGVKGQFALDGAAPLQVSFESGAPSGSLERLRLAALRADVRSGFDSRRVEGTVAADLLLQWGTGEQPFERLSFDRLDVKGVFDAGLGGTPWPLGARGSLGFSPDEASWNLNATLAEDACASEGRAQPAGEARERPALDLRLRCERLDLGRWRAPAPNGEAGIAGRRTASGVPGAATASAGDGGNSRKAATPPSGIASDAWRALDARVSLRAGQLRLYPVLARDVRLESSLTDGLLKLADMQAKVWDGTIDASGQAAVAQSTPEVDLRVQGNGVDVGAMLQDLTDAEPLQGRGRLSAELRGQGADLAALGRTLDGRAALQLRDGAIVGVDLLQTLREGQATVAEGQDTTTPAASDRKTGFSELKASFELAGGLARSQDLALRSPLLRLGGAGEVDLAKRRIDYLTRASVELPKRGPEAAQAAQWAPLDGLAVPVRLEGPLAAPDWHIRWSEAANLGGATSAAPADAPAPAHAPAQAPSSSQVPTLTPTSETHSPQARPSRSAEPGHGLPR